MKKYFFLMFLVTGCTINRAQLDRDIDLVNELECEIQKPISTSQP